MLNAVGIMPIYQKPNTSKAAKGHKIYPYLLRGLRVGRPNQVWCVNGGAKTGHVAEQMLAT